MLTKIGNYLHNILYWFKVKVKMELISIFWIEKKKNCFILQTAVDAATTAVHKLQLSK